MDLSTCAGLRRLFSGEFGRKWRGVFEDSKKQCVGNDCTAQAIGNGYLNKVYRLRGSFPKNNVTLSWSVVIKHTLPTVQLGNNTYPLGTRRTVVEHLALRKFNKIVSGAAPEVYFYDEETSCVVMEDLESYEVMRLQFDNGCLNSHVVTGLINVLSQLHRNTHVASLSNGDFQEISTTFSNDKMITFNADLLFVGVLDPNNPSNRCSDELVSIALSLRKDDQIFLDRVGELHRVFTGQKDCLIHGDLHLGSVMVDGDDVKLIDPEFAFVGPPAVDIGQLLANYIFYYLFYDAKSTMYPSPENKKQQGLVMKAIKDTVDVYFTKAREYLSEEAVGVLISQSAGFTGCHILKWTIGVANAKILTGKPQAEITCLNIAARLIREHHNIKSEEDLLRWMMQDQISPSL